MIEIIKTGLKERLRSMFWWSLGLVGYIGLNMATYPTLRDQAEQINKVFSQLPSAATSLLTDTGDVVSAEGFLSSKLLHLILPLLFSILAISLGSSLLAREERSGTLELLLARPLSRTNILLAKAVVGLIVISVVALVATVATIVLGGMVDLGLPAGPLALAVIMTAVLGTLFGSVAFMLTALGKHARLMSAGLASFLALGSYLVVSLDGLIDWFKYPAYLLPYNYYHPNQILDDTYSWFNVVGFLVAIIVLITIAAHGFRRRDIDA